MFVNLGFPVVELRLRDCALKLCPNDDDGDCSCKYLLANSTNMSTDKFSLVKESLMATLHCSLSN